MISKILKIKGLGKFKNFSYTRNDDLKFLKYTVLFGYNTYGKSTLTTIFRSLKTSDQKYLQGKKSFGYSENIDIDILDSNNQHLTLTNGWNNSNIVIFDNHFIHNSVYVGNEIEYRHKSSLHSIFIGEDVLQKVNKLKSLRYEQEELEGKRDKIKSGFTRNELGTFETFLKIKEVEKIQEKIDIKKEELKRLNNIATLKELIKNSPLSDTFKYFSTIIQKTLDTSAEKNIENHINKHWKDAYASKNFLADGVSLLKDELKECVFCGQNLASVANLIKDYKKVFGNTYKETQREIDNIGEKFLRFDLEMEMEKFSLLGVNCTSILNKKTLTENKTALDSEVKIKLKNLNHKIDCESSDKPFKIFVTELKKLHPTFDDINKQSFSAQKQQVLENELTHLELIQYRYSNDGCKLAENYQKEVDSIKSKKIEIDNLRKEIDKETTSAIEKNQNQINTILTDTLKANFTIQKLKSRSNLSRLDAHFVEYEFVVDGFAVPLSNKRSQADQEPLDKAHFGNTLSDSDKRLLSMAFFISSLQVDKNLKNKIVVLDDPFSSFDSNRKDYLAKAIIDIQNENGDSPEQTIILTHDDSFLGRLDRLLPTSETKILKIKHSSRNGSVLDTCNINELIEEQYFKDIKYIKNAVDNSSNIDEALNKVRKCFERVLRHKYYFMLDEETLKNSSISTYLDKIGNKCKVKDEILKNNWHEHMHDQHEIMKLSEPEKIQKLKDFLGLLEQI